MRPLLLAPWNVLPNAEPGAPGDVWSSSGYIQVHRPEHPAITEYCFLSQVLKRSSDRRGRRQRRGGRPAPQLTSTSTSRTAYAETRRWLLAKHGSVCAYCGQRVAESTITLDHVTPRRGQSAYDRRDNLVLACQPCNGAKADMPILSFLLRKRDRAAVLARYGAHLSPMLVDLVRGLAGEPGEIPARVKEQFDDLFFEDGESPYHESPYRD